MDRGRISEFIKQYIQTDGKLQELRKKASLEGVPVIREETEAFLRCVVVLTKPRRILELGTATGYSSIMMARADESREAIIDTVEDWEIRIPAAEANIREAGLSGRINLIKGDALEIMKSLDVPYDLVFIDAAKGQYPDYLAETMRLTRKGSVIIADNILQGGEIMESKFIVERRDRTIHKRMREFLDMVSNDERLDTSILPVGDGITFSVRCL
ncbi:MAG: O-methyltransferase [Lachnospiraceae bacterium]|nr:O-methyltransferase [Lachnospiraceae bacterium]